MSNRGLAMTDSRVEAPVTTEEEAWLAARREMARRTRRARFLPEQLFSEAGWNILLFLYDRHMRGDRVSVTDACNGSGAPATTALRWLQLLTEEGFLRRKADPQDLRRAWIELTEMGRKKLVTALTDSIACDSELTVIDGGRAAN